MSKTPISVISGNLGAGKTTLLRNIIEKIDRKFAVIMNEFGEIAIDTEIIQGKNVNVAELAGGCVCCSLTGEFEEAVKEVIEKYQPEIIIVETTGVAEPDALVIDITESMNQIKLDSVITVADADALNRFPQIGRTSRVQFEMADIIILNKIDLINESQRVETKTKIRQINKKAPLIETTRCEVDIDLLFGLEIEHHIKNVHPEHETKFESFTYTFKNPVMREQFEHLLLKLPTEIYRLKGFVEFVEDDVYLLNYVAGRWEFEPNKSDQLNLVFIGENIIAVKQRITNTLDKLQQAKPL
jgi:G3E family GTPase